LSSMAALSSGACSRLRCRTAWRILRLRLGSERSTRSSAFSLPAFGEVPAHISHSGRGGRLLSIQIGSPTAVAIVPAPVSALTIISASCSTHTILVRASSPGILAWHKPKGFIARRVTPSHVGLLCRVLFNRRLDCGLVGGCGRRSGYCCCGFISCRGNLRQGRNSFFRPRCWTRPRLAWDLSWRIGGRRCRLHRPD
jgi:hypothetical protein